MKGRRTLESKNTETHCKRRKPWKRHRVTDARARTASGPCLLCGIRQPISDHRSYRNHSKESRRATCCKLLSSFAPLCLLILLDQPILLRQVHTTTSRHSRCYYHASTHRGNQPLITDRLWALEVIKIVPGTWRELPFVTLRQVHQTRNDFLTNGYGYSNIGHGICRSEKWRTHKKPN